MQSVRVKEKDGIQNSDFLWIFNITFLCYKY